MNAVLLNSSGPLFMLLRSWAIERKRASLRQIAGMLLSLAGILTILSRGDPAILLQLELRAGDAWMLLAMLFLGESFHAFHAAAFTTIVAGVVIATRARSPG